jgi:hypothetical protein
MATVERRDVRRRWSKPQGPDLPVHRSLRTPLAFLERRRPRGRAPTLTRLEPPAGPPPWHDS